tara:strand:- start:701 stop:1027 length:327 start_codon:yes stop_codon:yes gene_type:complete
MYKCLIKLIVLVSIFLVASFSLAETVSSKNTSDEASNVIKVSSSNAKGSLTDIILGDTLKVKERVKVESSSSKKIISTSALIISQPKKNNKYNAQPVLLIRDPDSERN